MRPDEERKASMTQERRERILQIADELESQGLTATNSSVYARALGYRGHVVATMKQRRAERAALGGVAVVEEEEDAPQETTETPAVVLAEDLRQLESAFESWHASLEQIWVLEHEGPLDERTFSRARWLEYQMTSNVQQQERLRPALEQAQVREAIRLAQAQHDARLDEARTLAEQALQAVATVHDLFEDLIELFTTQTDAFFPFRDQRGHQAFDVQDGRSDARQLFQSFFGGHPHARDAFELLMMPLTIGMLRHALAECQRLKPFSPTAISAYLQHATKEEHTNGQHS